jgi:hypothetical protein
LPEQIMALGVAAEALKGGLLCSSFKKVSPIEIS